ncbi:MAG TPA: PIG-L deacetylase family protein [Egibacteraceae bacterium]|nr:PIG-L deacetylase family protein [Egibacteraceae bacterium]
MSVEQILVITAHPDDVDFGAAATVWGWTSAGTRVTYCVVTDGDNGGFDPDVPRQDIPGIRRAEQQAAAAEVGVDDVRFLGFPDGSVTVTMELRRALTRVIRQVRPQRVLTHSPERNWRNIYASHPDHLAVGEAAACAVYPDARNPFQFPELLRDEGLTDHIVNELWLMGGPSPDRFVDVTDAYDKKLAALQHHASQMTDPAGGAPANLRDRMRSNAERGGLPAGHLAEAFQVVLID